jgi:hypothetical protein
LVHLSWAFSIFHSRSKSFCTRKKTGQDGFQRFLAFSGFRLAFSRFLVHFVVHGPHSSAQDPKLARGRSSGVKGKKGGREREKRKGEIKNGKWSDPSGVKEIMKLTGK